MQVVDRNVILKLSLWSQHSKIRKVLVLSEDNALPRGRTQVQNSYKEKTETE